MKTKDLTLVCFHEYWNSLLEKGVIEEVKFKLVL